MADIVVPVKGLGRLTVILSLIVVSSALYEERQLCTHCDEKETATECTNYVWCATDEKCLTSQYQTVDGHTRFYTGCAAKQACASLERQGIAIPLDNLFPVPQRVLDQNCCDGQGCNGLRAADDFPLHDCHDAMSPAQCEVFPCENDHLASIYCKRHCMMCD